MLYRLLTHQQERFVKQGGIREQMLNARLAYRNKNK
jgi:four helix bundle suffix protein